MNTNKKVNIDSAMMKFLYVKYKQYLLPAGVIAVCAFLFIFVIIPQFQNLLSAQQQAKVEANKLAILRNNLNLLSNLDETQLNTQLQIVSTALPPGKDFAGILTAVSIAANRSGVSLGDYQFQVGDITKPQEPGAVSFPYLKLVLTINGGINGVTGFITELYKTAPLSEVTSVRVSSATSEVTAYFYFRPFPPLGFNDNVPVTIVSPQGLATITNLSSWNNAGGNAQAPIAPAAPVSTPAPQPQVPAATSSASGGFQ